MKYERGHRSRDVEDRRGQKPPRTGLKIGGGAAILAALVALVGSALGVDLSGLVGGGSSSGGKGQQSSSTGTGTGTAAPYVDRDPELTSFIHYALDDIQETFEKKFREEGKTYRRAKLVLFEDATQTGCGVGESSIGPFYCPPDEMAYIDLSFYRVLKERLGAGGDFAQAYVLAHEIGHHIQTVLGTDADVRRKIAGDKSRESDLSVRQELQADCYAGVWANSTLKRDMLERGDIEEAVNAAGAIGDDRLARMSGNVPNPETFSHGSSEQRMKWFNRGKDRGTLSACDTFSVGDP